MKRPAAALLGCIAVLLLIAVAGVATIPTVPTGTWQPIGSMAAARSGAAAVLLGDHRVLITGGNNGTDAVNSAEVFNADGSFAIVSAMGTPRSGHVAVVLRDERVLVAGGVTAGGGATNSAEIYDPASDTWVAIAGGMTEARSKATAVLLEDGRVLIAGGQNGNAPSSAVEIFDPNTWQFSFAGSLSSPRMGSASASLADGRVLITGGSNGNVPVATSDVFDPTTNTVSAAPAMTSPRVGHSATSLLDGRVLIAGGSNGSADLASAEVFDPAVGGFAVVGSNLAAPRRDHAAILLPNNNAVLIVGGTSSGNELNTAETFTPWTGTFGLTGSPAVARQQAAVSALNQDGLLVMAGGSSAGAAVSSAELYGFATVKTDKDDYTPGSVVTITGSGWQPGETVTLTLVESPLEDTHPVMTAVADGQGRITNSDFIPDEHDLDIRFYLTAVGNQSGYQAQNTFTDANPVSLSVTPSPVTVTPGGAANYTVSVSFGGNANACTVTFSTTGLPTGAVATPNPGSVTNTTTSSPLQVTTTASGGSATPPGTYTITVTGTRGGTCQGSGNVVGNATLIVAGQANHFSVSGFPSPTVAGVAHNFTVTALDANNNTAVGYTGTVNFSSSDAQAVSSPSSYTFVPGDSGTHTFTNGATLKTAGTQSITATDAGNGSINGSQTGITVNAAAANQLVFGTSSQTMAANACSAVITVQAKDAFGNNANPASTETLALSTNSTGGAFYSNASCTTTITSTTIATSATSANFFYKDTKTGSPTITVTGTGAFATTITQGETITAGTANKLAFTTSAQTLSAGACSAAITVQSQDASGNPANPASAEAVALSSNSPGGSFYNDAACGTASITNTSIPTSVNTATFFYKDTKAGSSTITATGSGAFASVITQIETITAGAASKLVFGQQPSNTLAGGTITPAVTVLIQDQFGNATTSAANVTMGIATNPSAGTLGGTTTVGAVSGAAAFSTLSINKAGSGYTLSASSGALTGATSNSFNIDTRIAFSSAAVTEAAGVCSPQVTVQRQNSDSSAAALGNSETVTLSANVGGTNFFSDASCANALSGNNLTIASGQSSAALYFENTSATPPPFTLILTATKNTFVSTSTTQSESVVPNIVFVSGIPATTVGVCSATAAKIVAVDGSGGTIAPTAPVVVTLTTSSANGAFYSDNTCTTVITTATIPAGNKSGAMAFYRDNSAGSPTLTATALPAQATSVATITKATAVFSNLSAPTIEYGDTPTTFSGTVNKSGSVAATGSVTITLAGTTGPISQAATLDANGNFTTAIVTGSIPAGSYTIQYSYAGDGNFNAPSPNPNVANSLTVNKKSVTPGITADDKDYDTTSAATIHCTLTGVLAGDTANVNCTGTGTFADANAGQNKAVTSNNLTLNGSAAGNYALSTTSASTTATIRKVDATINVTGYNVVYNGAAHTATGTATGVGGADLSSFLNLAGTTHTDAGDYPADAWTFTGSTNYNDKSGTVHDHIDKANATITVTPYSVTYDGDPHTATGSAKGVGGVDLSANLNLSGTTHTSAGTYTDTWTFTGSANYNDTSGTVSDVIAKADPVIATTGGTFTYDGNPHGGSATATGVKGEALTPVNVAYTVVAAPPRNPGDLLASAPVNAGNYSVAARFAGDTNYNQKQSTTTAVVINKATPTVSVSFGSSPVTYDGNPHPATAAVAGVGGADLTSGHGTVTVSYTPGPGAPLNAGSYTASAHFASSDGNYNDADSTVAASLTINKADPAVTAVGGTFTYDGSPHGGTATATGVNGEALTPVNVVYKDSLGTLLATAPVNAGTYSVAARYLGDTNYNQKQSAAAPLVIDKAESTTAVTCPANVTYNGSPQTPCTANVTGAGALNQALTPSYTNNINAGTATASATYAGDANHNGSNDSKNFTIDKAASVTTVTCPTNVTYSGSAQEPCAATVTGAGGLNQSLNVSYSNNLNAGTATASASFGGDANHTNSSDSKNFTIDKADPLITATGGAFIYDGNPHGGSATAVGVKGEPLTPVNVVYKDSLGTLLPTAPVNAGMYSVAARYLGDANYNQKQSAAAAVVIDKADSATTVSCPASVTFDGTSQTPCTATVTGAGGLNQALTPAYANNVNAGTATASATFAGDANHNGSSDSKNFTIEKAASVTTVICPANVTYNGLVQTPCSASVTGAGSLNQALTPSYSNNVDAGTATASASFTGDANHTASSDSKNFTIDKAASVTTVTCPANVTYNGSAQTPCSATVTGAGGLSESLTISYGNNTDAGTATASANYGGDANHTASSDSKSFTIEKAASVTTVICPTNVTYNGSAQEPCMATVTGAGGLSLTPTPSYGNNTNAGTATASYSYAGDANHTASSDSKSFTIEKAASVTTVICPTNVTFTGAALTPCSTTVTGAGGLNLTPTPSYNNNVSAGTATASYTYAGDTNHSGSSDSKNFTIDKASTATTLTCPTNVAFTGAALTPCSASVTGAGGLNQSLSVSYTNNLNAGTASASASYAGDANHDGSNDSKTFTIDKAASTTTVTCPASVNYNALPQTPCTATVAGAALSISPTPAYSNNVNAGTATASYNYAGDLNHTASSDSKTFAINKAVLTVKADNKSMLLHAALPALTASYSGFKGSDSFANSVTGAPSLTASATSASPVGAYAIAAALGTLAANNYSFGFVGGTLTISYSMSVCLGDVGHTILQPINADGSSVFNGKSTSPAKFRVCDASGASIGTAGVVQSFVLYQTIQGTVTSTVNEPVDSTTPDLNFRFDPSAQQWIFNINNKALSPNRTYIFLITLNDQSTIPFQYGLR